MSHGIKKVISALRETGFFKPKRIYDGGKVIIGVIVLFILVGFPFLYHIGKAAKVPEPEVDTAAIQRIPDAERACIESREYMKVNHMKLLYAWREQVVREGNREYVSRNKKRYVISLQNTCLKCHSNYDNFCNRCHKSVGIQPACWSCHLNKPEQWAQGKPEEVR